MRLLLDVGLVRQLRRRRNRTQVHFRHQVVAVQSDPIKSGRATERVLLLRTAADKGQHGFLQTDRVAPNRGKEQIPAVLTLIRVLKWPTHASFSSTREYLSQNCKFSKFAFFLHSKNTTPSAVRTWTCFHENVCYISMLQDNFVFFIKSFSDHFSRIWLRLIDGEHSLDCFFS